ncbi:MAG: O-succinylhomoserine sulfhydrylase [Rickettsiales bacterium]
MKRNKNTRDVAESWNLDTQLVRGGTWRSELGETSEAIYLNSGFCYDSAEIAASRFDGTSPGYVYSRYLNPNLKMLEDRLALIEGAEACIVMGSGMAAVNASLMSFLKTGDHVIAHQVLFGSCHYIINQILPRFGIEVTLVDGTKRENWEKAFRKNTAAVFIETPANPNLEIVDIEMIASFTKKHGAKLIVDNIFASPLLQKPLALGADLVVYSTTKHMDGQGRTLGGAVLGEKEFLEKIVMPFHRHTGPALSPFNAWVILKSLETFALRVTRQCESALKIAASLEKQKNIVRVLYPGLPSHPQYEIARRQMQRKGEPCGGTMVAFEAKGGREGAFRLMNALQIIDISNNLGDAKSLLTHPASTTHSNLTADERQAAGISEGLLRLSVGLEDCDDLENDLIQAAS